jgi:hypothetical protein
MLLSLVLVAPPGAGAARVERTFERGFRIAGPVTLDVLTRSGRVEVRAGAEGAVTVRGVVQRNVSWRGAQVTDAQIDSLRQAPPVRADGDTVRIERIADDALWRGVSIDYEIVVPATATVLVVTESGGVLVAGSRGDVRAETGSGAVRVDAEGGTVDLRSGSGGIRVAGNLRTLAMKTQSGAIVADTGSVETVDASSGSGSVTVSGVRGSARAETGSGQIALDGSPTGDWTVRSRSGSVSIRMPDSSRFDLVARSRSGNVETTFAVTGPVAPSKHVVEGAVNGGGPKVDVETGSSQITLRS